MIIRPSDATIASDLASAIETFERENPDLVKELDIIGMEVDRYVQTITWSDPPVTTSNSTTPTS